MMVKFRLELFELNDLEYPYSITNGTADEEDIDKAIEYLLKLKQERYTSRDISGKSVTCPGP